MARHLLACVLVLTSGAIFAGDMNCGNIPLDWYVARNLSIREVESASIERIKDNQTVPQVPFGYQNERWQALKAAMQEGDELVRFSSPPETWQSLGGRAGYALVRNGCVVKAITTARN